MSGSDPAHPDHDTSVASSPAPPSPTSGSADVHVPLGSEAAEGREPRAGRLGRARGHLESGRRRMDTAYQRLQDSRSRIGSVDVAFTVQEGDRDAGGSLLGGAIAFRHVSVGFARGATLRGWSRFRFSRRQHQPERRRAVDGDDVDCGAVDQSGCPRVAIGSVVGRDLRCGLPVYDFCRLGESPLRDARAGMAGPSAQDQA